MSSVEVVGVQMTRKLFTRLLAELSRRGQGRRESGAFLLARAASPDFFAARGDPEVVAVAYYDDLDPACLTGGITFGAAGYAALNTRCRNDRLRVVGDVHTHPRHWVAQSAIDAAHPMVALNGHLALIVPNYARGRIRLEDLGAHVFNAPGWTSHFTDQVPDVVTLTGSSPVRGVLRRVRATVGALVEALSRLGHNAQA